ncbi:sugar phosphate nucleotidyltransferase, partial [Staphylococcus aureus]
MCLGDGSQWGLSLTFAVQPNPGGLAQAFHVGKDFVGDHSCAMILGDNIFFGHGLQELVQNAAKIESGARVFAYHVDNPREY